MSIKWKVSWILSSKDDNALTLLVMNSKIVKENLFSTNKNATKKSY